MKSHYVEGPIPEAATGRVPIFASRKPENFAGYDMLFVGLVCFLLGDKSRLILLPDGTSVDETLTRHFPYIVVDPSSIDGTPAGWENESAAEKDRIAQGMFRLPKCELSIDGVDGQQSFDPTQHDQFVPKLVQVDPSVQIDPATAKAVVRMRISSGSLEAFRRPFMADDDDEAHNPTDVSVISRLRVSHEGAITITASGDGGATRTLRLKPGTDIALANIAFPDDGTGFEHFPIYGQLTKNPISVTGAQSVSADIPALPPPESGHHIFRVGMHINDGTAACGNQGCCRPPGGP